MVPVPFHQINYEISTFIVEQFGYHITIMYYAVGIHGGKCLWYS